MKENVHRGAHALASGVRGGESAAPLAWKNQGKLCFQGKRKLVKHP